jgi:hypothetical protein
VRNRLLLALPAVPLLLAAGLWTPGASVTNYDSARWIESGLDHEMNGDLQTAESDLLEAARLDRLLQPRWTLAGFYFRRNDPEHFWHWTHEALAVGRRDLWALFDLSWKMPDASRRIWSDAMPESKLVWNEYLFYVTTTNKWPDAAVTALHIANAAESSDKANLLNYCDTALAHADKTGANAVWNALRHRGLLPFPEGPILSNGDFRAVPSNRGFDWRLTVPGIANPFHLGEASFTLNGFERDQEIMLEQLLALDPSHTYLAKFEYKTTGLDANSGVHWVAGSNKSQNLSAIAWTPGEFEFSGASPSLALIYDRPPISIRAEGTIAVRNVSALAK